MSNIRLFALASFVVFRFACAAICAQPMPGVTLTMPQKAAAIAAVKLMDTAKLFDLEKLANKLLATGQIRYANSDDPWLAAAEKAADTPYAYTLPDPAAPKGPTAIVLAPRYFDTTPRAQTALRPNLPDRKGRTSLLRHAGWRR